MPRRRRTPISVAFMLVVLAGVAISAVAGLQGGALVGALALLVMVVGALALAR